VSARLVALHGVLGQASDWDRIAVELPGVRIDAVNLWDVLGGPGVVDWATAIAAVDDALAARLGGTAGGEAPFVLGYSMGARLLLGSRLLSSSESPASGCCLVSCNPGLPDDDEVGRASRRESDAAWGRRVLEDPEDEFWQAWDARSVFAGSRTLPRRQQFPAERGLLARVLAATSLAGQPDRRPALRAWPSPVLWVTGGRDQKFSGIAREVEASGIAASFVSFQEAGHRVPWDNPPAFAAVLQEWMAQ
jgi:2-succinyl-6-hydroxy-2,4-cyclohexadiene-1-carboxylate synthase